MALHTSAEPETILAALRAGANEYLYPPLETNLRRALERRPRRRTRLRDALTTGRQDCLVSVVQGRLRRYHHRLSLGRGTGPGRRTQACLLADLDVDAGIVSFLMKVKSPYSVLDAVHNLHRLDCQLLEGAGVGRIPGLEIVSSPQRSGSTQAMPEQEQFGKCCFASVQLRMDRCGSGPQPEPVAVTALDEIDEIYLVTTLEVPALHQAKQMVHTLMDAATGKPLARWS